MVVLLGVCSFFVVFDVIVDRVYAAVCLVVVDDVVVEEVICCVVVVDFYGFVDAFVVCGVWLVVLTALYFVYVLIVYEDCEVVVLVRVLWFDVDEIVARLELSCVDVLQWFFCGLW